MEENSGMGPGSESAHSSGYGPNQVLTPTPPPTPFKKWYLGMGGVEGSKSKNAKGIHSSPETMILFSRG